jgi:hypothetical protein
LDPEALEAAITRVVADHPALHTTLHMHRRRLRTRRDPPHALPLHHRQATSVDAAIELGLATELDPSQELIRAVLVRLGDQDHVLCLSIHHAACDGVSGHRIWEDLLARLDGRPPACEGWSSEHFARWQRSELSGPSGDSHRDFWRRELDGASALPLRRGDRSGSPQVHRSALPPLPRMRASPFCVGLALLDALVVARSGARDLCVGTLFANRQRPELRHTVGFLTSLGLLRVKLPRLLSFRRLVTLRAESLARALAHQIVPLHALPRGIGPGQPAVVFQMLPHPHRVSRLGPLVARSLAVTPRANRFDLELTLVPADEGFELVAVFDSGRYPGSWTRQLLEDFGEILERVSRRPDAAIA